MPVLSVSALEFADGVGLLSDRKATTHCSVSPSTNQLCVLQRGKTKVLSGTADDKQVPPRRNHAGTGISQVVPFLFFLNMHPLDVPQPLVFLTPSLPGSHIETPPPLPTSRATSSCAQIPLQLQVFLVFQQSFSCSIFCKRDGF